MLKTWLRLLLNGFSVVAFTFNYVKAYDDNNCYIAYKIQNYFAILTLFLNKVDNQNVLKVRTTKPSIRWRKYLIKAKYDPSFFKFVSTKVFVILLNFFSMQLFKKLEKQLSIVVTFIFERFYFFKWK